MNEYELTKSLYDLFVKFRKSIILPTLTIIFRAGGFTILLPEELEAGDLIIVPPSLVTMDSPTNSYIQGCVEKCWPQIREKIQ